MVDWFLPRRVEIAYALALGGSLVLLVATGAAWGLLLLSIIAAAHVLPAREGILGASVSRFFMSTLMILSLYQIEAVIASCVTCTPIPRSTWSLSAVAVGAAWVGCSSQWIDSTVDFQSTGCRSSPARGACGRLLCGQGYPTQRGQQ